jgi:hypothetical protein
MPLAAILGLCLLLYWPQDGIVLPAAAVWRSTESRENQANNSPAQGSSPQPSQQPKNPDQSGATPRTPAAAPSCPENSQSGSTAKPGCAPAPSAKTKKHHGTHKAVEPAATAAGTPPTTRIVNNGGTEEPAVDLSPEMNRQQALQQANRADQLLADSDANLKKISGRQLSASQQDTVKQIKSYMEQATTAKKDGDVQRAYNLALKANLLSAELAGH